MRLSCDDGCASDRRVADLATKYEVEATFYWPVEWHSLAYENGYEPLAYHDALDIARAHEVGSHTITHRHLTKLDPAEAAFEIVNSKTMLERLFNTEITKFAPPRGYTNPSITEATLAVYKSQRLTRGPGLVHVHPNSGANGHMDWLEYARTHEVEELWFHSWELDKYDLWDQLEDYLRAL
jgi:peptidoglycan/xylan/chitin deacetylase (PgdA/CDA1 family)